jgi:superfamily I DNA and/or RNA helicase
VGDPQQLPATVMSQAAKAVGYDRSAFARLQGLGHTVSMLEVQYRWAPASIPPAT